MIRTHHATMSAVVGAGLAVLSVAAAPLAAYAEMTNPPACTESPYGGCQDGPIGNGVGGPVSPGGPDVFNDFAELWTGYVGTWKFERLDGQMPTAADATRIFQASPMFKSCAVSGLYVVCYD